MITWRSNFTEHHQIYTRCSHIQCAFHLPIRVPIFQSVVTNKGWSAKNANLAYKMVAMATSF